MQKLVRLMLVAGLLATVGVPFTTAGAQVGTFVDDAGPLPDWYAETVYGFRAIQAEGTGMAKGPAVTSTDAAAPREPIRFESGDSRYVNH